MKAAVIAAPGETPTYATFQDPTEQAGREVVQVVAAGIHPVVRSTAAGQHYSSRGGWPRIPGVDAIARTGDGRMVYTGWPEPPFGTLAERVSVPVPGFEVPEGADPVTLAGGLNPGLATWLPLYAAGFASGDTSRPLNRVLVLGATGAAGSLAVQNARVLGAEQIVSVGRNADALAATRELGATHTVPLVGDPEADTAALAAALGDTAPDIVLDLVWGTVAEAAFATLMGLRDRETETTYVHIGSMAGQSAQLPGALLRSRPIKVIGSGMGSVPMPVLQSQIPRYIDLIATKQVTPHVVSYPLSDIEAAWSAGESSGPRVVVTP